MGRNADAFLQLVSKGSSEDEVARRLEELLDDDETYVFAELIAVAAPILAGHQSGRITLEKARTLAYKTMAEHAAMSSCAVPLSSRQRRKLQLLSIVHAAVRSPCLSFSQLRRDLDLATDLVGVAAGAQNSCALDAERSRTKAAFSDGDPSANYGLTYSNSGPDGDTFRDLELEEEGERENELLQDLLVDALSRRLVSGRIDEVNEKFDVIAVLLARDVYLPSGPAQAPVAKSAASSSSSATATSDLDFMESVLSSWQGRSRFLQDQIHQMMEQSQDGKRIRDAAHAAAERAAKDEDTLMAGLQGDRFIDEESESPGGGTWGQNPHGDEGGDSMRY